MKATLSHELYVQLPADELWEVFSGLRLKELIVELLPNWVEKFEVLQGDGGVGTVVRLTFPSESIMPKFQKEVFVKVDHENRVKETKVIEGGYLELGHLNSCSIRFQIKEKEVFSSIIISSLEYEIDDEFTEKASLITVDLLAAVSETVSKYMIQKKKHVAPIA